MFHRVISQTLMQRSVSRFCLTPSNLPSLATAAFSSSSAAASSISAESVATTVRHPFTLEPHPRTEYPVAEDDRLFAVITLKGKQHKVTLGDVIVADYMGPEFDLDTKITVPEVLLVGSKKATVVGQPVVPESQVVLSVEEITRDAKVIALKYRRRKNSRRRHGFRRDLTVLRVVDISCPNPEL